MAIFAKRQDNKRFETKDRVDAGAPSTQPGMVQPAVEMAAPETTANETATSQPAGTLPGMAAVAGSQTPVPQPVAAVAAGAAVAGQAVLEPVDIEPEVVDPETIGTTAEASPAPVFGISDAINLMRSLPSDQNMDLVVRVVRVTLGAVKVSIEEIMEDARRKERGIQGSIAALEGQVSELEKQLYARRCEIAAHQADLKETANVRERLYQADKYTGHRPPPTPPDAARIPLSKLAEWGKSDQVKSD